MNDNTVRQMGMDSAEQLDWYPSYPCDMVAGNHSYFGRPQPCSRTGTHHIGIVTLCWQHYAKMLAAFEAEVRHPRDRGYRDGVETSSSHLVILVERAEQKRAEREAEELAAAQKRAADAKKNARLSRIGSGVLS